jgi:transcriptional regulator GlxA family with amidase domain
MARRVVIVIGGPVRALEVAGATDVLSAAHTAGKPAYALEIVSGDGGWVRTNSVLRLATQAVTAASTEGIDTVFVAGAPPTTGALDPASMDWLQRAAPGARRVAGIGTGTFILAELGVLDGRRATTHWAAREQFAQSHPAVALDHDVLFVEDGHFYSSAGASAAVDLALALVEDDLGADAATEIARDMVLLAMRPGSQPQISAQLAANIATRDAIRELQAWIAANLDRDLSVAALARRASMSKRSLSRVFRAEVGMTPSAYVEALRIESARIALERTQHPLKVVARISGFSNVERMRRAFQRNLGIAPGAYRAQRVPNGRSSR